MWSSSIMMCIASCEAMHIMMEDDHIARALPGAATLNERAEQFILAGCIGDAREVLDGLVTLARSSLGSTHPLTKRAADAFVECGGAASAVEKDARGQLPHPLLAPPPAGLGSAINVRAVPGRPEPPPGLSAGRKARD